VALGYVLNGVRRQFESIARIIAAGKLTQNICVGLVYCPDGYALVLFRLTERDLIHELNDMFVRRRLILLNDAQLFRRLRLCRALGSLGAL
jgi:hypothetical protein